MGNSIDIKSPLKTKTLFKHPTSSQNRFFRNQIQQSKKWHPVGKNHSGHTSAQSYCMGKLGESLNPRIGAYDIPNGETSIRFQGENTQCPRCDDETRSLPFQPPKEIQRSYGYHQIYRRFPFCLCGEIPDDNKPKSMPHPAALRLPMLAHKTKTVPTRACTGSHFSSHTP